MKTPSQHRTHIENTARTVLERRGRELVVTSRYRSNSAAHRRGALDYSSNKISSRDRHAEAEQLSRDLGDGYTVVVEEVHRAKETQTNTSYRNGQRINRHEDPITADETHTHVQPDRPLSVLVIPGLVDYVLDH